MVAYTQTDSPGAARTGGAESDSYDCVVVAGRRSCPGEQLARQELTLFVVALLQSFYFKPPEGQDTVEVHDVCGMTTAPSAYRVRMIPRHDA